MRWPFFLPFQKIHSLVASQLLLGAATGGFKGDGSVNAAAYYLNGAAFSVSAFTKSTILTAGTSWANPDNATTVIAVLQAAGGGGGGSKGTGGGNNGVGCGGYAGQLLAVLLQGVSGSIAYTLGAGGTAGSNTPGDGGNGGDTTVGTGPLFTAKGGVGGGKGDSAIGSPKTPAQPVVITPSASGVLLSIWQNVDPLSVTGLGLTHSGAGQNSPYGTGGAFVNATNGANGTGYGSGASGGASTSGFNNTGGVGAPGLIAFIW